MPAAIPDQADLTSMRFILDFAPGECGFLIVNTPFLKDASVFPASTPGGSRMVRMARKPEEGFVDEKLWRGIPAQEIGQRLHVEGAAIRIVRVIVKDFGAMCMKDTASRTPAAKHATYVVLCCAQASKRRMARMPPVVMSPARRLAPSVIGRLWFIRALTAA